MEGMNHQSGESRFDWHPRYLIFTSINVSAWLHLTLAGTQESEALLLLSGPLLRSERLLQTTASPSSNMR